MKKQLLLIVYGLVTGLFALFFWYFGFREDNRDEWNENPIGLMGSMEEKYVMVTFQSGLDYWKSIMKGFEDAAQVLNVSVEFRGASQYDANEEITVLEQVIAMKPAGIAVTAINPEALVGTIDKAIKAGIPVVLFDSDSPSSKAYSFLGTDNYGAGAQAARELGRLLSGQGKAAVVTQPNQLNHEERTKGFTETLKQEFPAIQVVRIADGRGKIQESEKVAKAILRQYPDLDGFFATQANGGVGIGKALKESGVAKSKVVIGFDTDKGTLDLVKDGTINATIAQGTWNMGYWSLLELFHQHHDLVQPNSEDIYGAHPLPSFIDTGVTIVTQDNVDNYYAK
ncbi:substrate-binding domain-containing protein [Cohnella cholangitidis]|uniref:Sugar ABC transporter substrate-binding protein n=1 Tax=Cohnella cholangitidis TaxID=2598458 RepID=A0A7G5C1S2_9BACL|nr:substrate-binding domain-containing protein [Cohnella cholangitidis]QMV43156.1 sugar ABC transporter substrate-binding protein [Cohnella cholangitidis]